jgi:hypothetical protein
MTDIQYIYLLYFRVLGIISATTTTTTKQKIGLSLPLVVCMRVHVLFTLFVFVWFVFTSSCLYEGSCLMLLTQYLIRVQMYLKKYVNVSEHPLSADF